VSVISTKYLIKEQFKTALEGRGYRELAVSQANIGLFYRTAQTKSYCILFLNYPEELPVTLEQYVRLRQSAVKIVEGRELLPVELLSVLCTADLEKAKMFSGQDNRCWILEPISRELILYENQYSDMDGIREILEEVLHASSFSAKLSWNALPVVSMALVGINAFLFLVCAFTGDLLYNKGAFSLEDVVLRGEWYRIITAMFLHAGVGHLFSNMILLYFAGKIVERYLGHFRYGVLYLLSGIGGNLLSMWYESRTGYYSSVGASGAIFGIIGMLFALVLLHHGRLEEITLRRIALMIVLSVYNGATSAAVNNVAHVGGLLTGLLLTLFLSMLGLAERKNHT